jgi:hypothetical protein
LEGFLRMMNKRDINENLLFNCVDALGFEHEERN